MQFKLLQIPVQGFILSLCSGLGISCAVISVTVSALAGYQITGDNRLATLPYGTQFFTIILFSYIASILMKKHGRKTVFVLGAISCVFAGLTGFYSVSGQLFPLLVLSHVFLGLSLTCTNFYRFAILDFVSKELTAYGVSLVLFGGVLASILGPTVVRLYTFESDLKNYSYSYLSMSAIGVTILIVILLTNFSKFKNRQEKNLSKTADNGKPDFSGGVIFAIVTGGLIYALMNSLMIGGSLAMKHDNHEFRIVSIYIQIHVFCMFFPSLFSGYIIDKLSLKNFFLIGFIFQIISNISAISGKEGINFLIALLFLGLSWNFLFVGATTFIGNISKERSGAFRLQGVNETVVSIFSATSALSSGFLLDLFGWKYLNVLSLILLTGLMIMYFVNRKYIS